MVQFPSSPKGERGSVAAAPAGKERRAILAPDIANC
jgi:hypothetical protein